MNLLKPHTPKLGEQVRAARPTADVLMLETVAGETTFSGQL